MSVQHPVMGLVLGAAATLWSSAALAYPADLQVRPLYGTSSCESALFASELKIVNTSEGPLSASSLFPEFAFQAGTDEIEAVYPQVFAVIHDAAGNAVGWTGATVEKSPWALSSEYSDDRKTNQQWRVRFDPPSAQLSNLIPAHGFVSVGVALRRAGGAVPFDQDCNDFSKVSLDDGLSFQNDPYVHLIFTSTQQLVCEDLGGGNSDPASGLSFFEPFTSACR